LGIKTLEEILKDTELQKNLKDAIHMNLGKVNKRMQTLPVEGHYDRLIGVGK
jgi:hypothetical protein